MYALHIATQHNKGYIGGAWVRFLEFLKRAEKFDIKYVLVEPPPKFGDNYESILINAKGYEEIGDTAFAIFNATIKGIRRVLKGDIDLILSPIESPHCILPSFITSILTGTPFTVIVHNVPVFHGLIEENPDKKFSLTLRDFYKAIRYYKHEKKPIHYITLSTLFNYLESKILKTTTIIGIGSGATYLQLLDKKLSVREVFPGNSIPSIEIILENKSPEKKIYDAVYVGSLKEEKGVLDSIHIWKIVTKKNPSLTLKIIGRVNNKMMLQQLNKLIDKLDLGNNVYLCDDPISGVSTSELIKSMKQSKIMLFPSKLEAWSFAVGEALSLGLPVIGYDLQAYKRAYPNCKALIKVPLDNLQKFAAEVTRLFENPNKVLTLSREALEYMSNYYTWNQVISAEKKLYKEVIYS